MATLSISQSPSADNIQVSSSLGTMALRSSIADDRGARWDKIIDDLYTIRLYKNDWDGLGASAPPREVVESAILYLESRRRDPVVNPPSRVAATPAGTLMIEWQDNGEYFEIEFTAPFEAEWMLVNREGIATHGVVDVY